MKEIDFFVRVFRDVSVTSMSFKTYMFRSAMRKCEETELRTFFDFVAVPDQKFDSTLFQDWTFEIDNMDIWNAAVRSADYIALNTFISEFEDKIIDNFLRASSDNTIYISDRVLDAEESDHIYFRDLICSVYMYIYGDYINTVYEDFDHVAKRVYREVFDEFDDEGCEDPLSE